MFTRRELSMLVWISFTVISALQENLFKSPLTFGQIERLTYSGSEIIPFSGHIHKRLKRDVNAKEENTNQDNIKGEKVADQDTSESQTSETEVPEELPTAQPLTWRRRNTDARKPPQNSAVGYNYRNQIKYQDYFPSRDRTNNYYEEQYPSEQRERAVPPSYSDYQRNDQEYLTRTVAKTSPPFIYNYNRDKYRYIHYPSTQRQPIRYSTFQSRNVPKKPTQQSSSGVSIPSFRSILTSGTGFLKMLNPLRYFGIGSSSSQSSRRKQKKRLYRVRRPVYYPTGYGREQHLYGDISNDPEKSYDYNNYYQTHGDNYGYFQYPSHFAKKNEQNYRSQNTLLKGDTYKEYPEYDLNEYQYENVNKQLEEHPSFGDSTNEEEKEIDFLENFPLREDLYVGKDGNIYIKDEQTRPEDVYGLEETPTPDTPRPKKFKPGYNTPRKEPLTPGFSKPKEKESFAPRYPTLRPKVTETSSPSYKPKRPRLKNASPSNFGTRTRLKRKRTRLSSIRRSDTKATQIESTSDQKESPTSSSDNSQRNPMSRPQSKLAQSMFSSDSEADSSSTGFYPGDGFFEADFYTVSEMNPSEPKATYSDIQYDNYGRIR